MLHASIVTSLTTHSWRYVEEDLGKKQERVEPEVPVSSLKVYRYGFLVQRAPTCNDLGVKDPSIQSMLPR